MPAYVVWQAGTTNRFVVLARQGWGSIPELLKRFKNTGSGWGSSLTYAASLE
jgi:hypothetical protein